MLVEIVPIIEPTRSWIHLLIIGKKKERYNSQELFMRHLVVLALRADDRVNKPVAVNHLQLPVCASTLGFVKRGS